MLSSPASGGITAFSVAKAYYSSPSHSSTINAATNPCYDSSFFSSITDERSRFQMDVVSRLSQEVRTATTTGKVQELRQSVSAGEYTPDPAAIARQILFIAEGNR